MKRIKILLVCVLFPVICFCQEVQKDTLVKKVIIKCIRSISAENIPLYVMNGKISNQKEILALKNEEIESVNVIKGKEATSLYGRKGINGVVILKTKYQIIKNNKIKLITGTVSDKVGILLDAKVRLKGSEKSTSTDFEGVYKIEAKEGDILIFSFIGMITQEIVLDNCEKLNVKLNSDPNEIEVRILKPIIYLYPEKETAIDLKFDFVGKLATTFPKYDKNWSVIAYPDGKIFDTKTKRFYSSLFWDGIFNFPKEHYNYKDGFVVSRNNLTDFLIQKLEFMGLSTSETNEFIQFWLPLMDKNEINLIHFWVNDDYTVFSKNTVRPKPDTSLRIFMEYSKVDEHFKIQEQKLFKTKRKGFTLVEWGGSDVSTILKTEL